MLEKLKEYKDRYDFLVNESCKPEVIQDMEKWKKITKEQSDLEEYATLYNEYTKAQNDLKSAEEVLKDTDDSDLIEMAKTEIDENTEKLKVLEDKIKLALLPKDSKDDSKSVIVEIRSGAGGDESSLFGAELFNMYKKYAEKQGWKIEITEYNETEVGGIREAVMILTGKNSYKRLKFESGVHRVQRVPETESQGRVHTSTVTVAVLPQVEEVSFVIEDKDLKINTYRSTGCGGQGVNTTDSAVRLTHLPTGMVVTCQDERSQIKNREKALNILKAKLQDFYEEKAINEHQQERKAQVGTGDRSERIRTYNFPQGRVTDHRIGLSQYNINEFMLGDIDSMLDALFEAEQKIKLESLNKNN
ncbi:MAG: peptide chain release factor 1 [Clostridia bacterium]|nr:peptide chain release factor 1 [Clostridia bacterium]